MRFLVLIVFGSVAAMAQTSSSGAAVAGPPQAPAQQQHSQPSGAQAAKPASISGQVVSTAGEPVRRADVTARRVDVRDGGMRPVKVSTDASGMFTVDHLEPGRYMISIEKPGYVSTQYGATRNSRVGSTIQLAPGQELKGVTVKLMPHAVITGKVTDEEGEPINRVMVNALQQRYFRGRRQWMPVGGGQVNDLGEYRIPGLAPGRYMVAVMPQRGGMMGVAEQGKDAEMGYVTTWYPGATDQAQATPVEVTSGAEMRNVDFRLARTRVFHVRGKVVDGATNKPTQNVMVMVVERDAFSPFMGRNSAPVRGPDGAFDVTGITPGSYEVIANRMSNTERLTGRAHITVTDQNADNVVITLMPGASLPGTVRVDGATKLNLDNLRVFLQSEGIAFFGGAPAEVNADGTFHLDNLSPDKYNVRVTPLPDAYVKAIRLGNQEIRDTRIDLSSGVAGSIEIVLGTDAASVTATIQDSKKRPAQGVIAVLAPDLSQRSREDLFRVVQTDANGTASFTGIPPGDYKLFAWEQIEDGSWSDPGVLSQYESQAKAVALKPGAKETITSGFIAPDGGSQIEREADEREKAK